MHRMLFEHGLVILSGGQDSTTCLYLAKRECRRVSAITFDYGQRHLIEIGSAMTIAGDAGVPHELIVLPPYILQGTSPLINRRAQVETYADAQSLPGGIEKTFVPMRNALFIVIAYNRAVAAGCDAIYCGVSQEDYGGYPDCRKTFLDSIEIAARQAIGESAIIPALRTPLLFKTKRETVNLAIDLGRECMDALAYSHTCYKGTFPPCGACHACILREKGFAEAGWLDPLVGRASKIDGTPANRG